MRGTQRKQASDEDKRIDFAKNEPALFPLLGRSQMFCCAPSCEA